MPLVGVLVDCWIQPARRRTHRIIQRAIPSIPPAMGTKKCSNRLLLNRLWRTAVVDQGLYQIRLVFLQKRDPAITRFSKRRRTSNRTVPWADHLKETRRNTVIPGTSSRDIEVVGEKGPLHGSSSIEGRCEVVELLLWAPFS